MESSQYSELNHSTARFEIC